MQNIIGLQSNTEYWFLTEDGLCEVKITNSDMHSMHIRKLNNAGENFLTESGVYKLIDEDEKLNVTIIHAGQNREI